MDLVSQPDDRPVFDDRTSDEYGEGWGDQTPQEEADEATRRLREDKPPHHGD
ncbi:MAG: hypothetical protein QOK42_1702 [Frankiaceae bacterium]|jgi:hypothetical protein|nr:hypothetical protein [Frankiaceae bacterium]MDX6225661.1 hypothetical protein [Frankiales bacterium]MDX6275251.1 hypothetical protein [Frankiales bacterium]